MLKHNSSFGLILGAICRAFRCRTSFKAPDLSSWFY